MDNYYVEDALEALDAAVSALALVRSSLVLAPEDYALASQLHDKVFHARSGLRQAQERARG